MSNFQNINIQAPEQKFILCAGQKKYHPRPSRFSDSTFSEVKSHTDNDVNNFLLKGNKITQCKPSRKNSPKKIVVTNSIFS